MLGQITTLFIDDGGVLNDNSRRGPEWLRLIGEFLPARLGGTAEQWVKANPVVFSQVWANLQKQLPEFVSYQEFYRTYVANWMNGMCAHVGITPPPNDDAIKLYMELSCYVSERANSSIAGAADAVLSLHRSGFTLYTASGTPSWELRGIMAKMGISRTFSGLYGPDLIDCVKHGNAFYQKVFNHAGVDPSKALVIESESECCRWASEAGANAVWVNPNGQGDVTTLEMLVHKLV